jgi:outer membrane receptor for ferrienterochelin and colicin
VDLNTSLNPETSFQKEAGLKWEPNTNFSINISAFQIDIQDQITGYEIKDAPGRNILPKCFFFFQKQE